MALNLMFRLACASQHAYGIYGDGSVDPFPQGAVTYTNRDFRSASVGYTRPPVGFQAGVNGRDAALIATIPEGILISVRGTTPPGHFTQTPNQVIDDWRNDAVIQLAPTPDFVGKVHTGFQQAFSNIWKEMGPVFNQMNTTPGRRIFITGHSKGGAVAALIARHLAKTVHNPITVRVFAPARIGDPVFAADYDNHVKDHIRYEFDDDLVPHLPIMTSALASLGLPSWTVGLVTDRDPGYGSIGRLRYILPDQSIAAKVDAGSRLFDIFAKALNVGAPPPTLAGGLTWEEAFKRELRAFIRGPAYLIECHSLFPGYASARFDTADDPV